MSPAEKLLLEAVRHAEWHDKHIHPFNGETYQTWELTVYLPVPLSQADKSPETALQRALLGAAQSPLTDEQMDRARIDAGIAASNVIWDILKIYGRAVERAHGIK